MNIRDAYDRGTIRLKNSGVPEPELDAWYLLEHVTGIGRAAFYAYPDRSLTDEEDKAYDACIARREKREPLQHITGCQEFMGLNFRVSREVLIPRQDTEILAEQAVEAIRGWNRPVRDGTFRLLDLCTGSGCILLSVMYYVMNQGAPPGFDVQGTGADLSGRALAIAKQNAELLQIPAEFVRGDLFENLSGKFDMILSNPPYIPTGEIELLQDEVRLFDPREALDGMEDGLYFYRRIAEECREFLAGNGRVIFEIGSDQGEAVVRILQEAGFREIRVKKDLAGLDRTVTGVR